MAKTNKQTNKTSNSFFTGFSLWIMVASHWPIQNAESHSRSRWEESSLQCSWKLQLTLFHMREITKTDINDDSDLHIGRIILSTLFSFIETYI